MRRRVERMGRWLVRWGPALVLMAVIFLASATPSRQLPDFGLWDRLVKKGGHALGYALLAVAYRRALADGRPFRRRDFALAWALAGLYALSDEFHQTFTAGRTPAWLDVGIDVSGALAGLAARALAMGLGARRRLAAEQVEGDQAGADGV